jgi:hypothetical protein
MIISIKKEDPITEEQKEKHYWDLLKHESHRWVEFSNGYYECAFCKAIHTSVMPLGAHKLCTENPNLK